MASGREPALAFVHIQLKRRKNGLGTAGSISTGNDECSDEPAESTTD